jgi:hypothetical protein
VDSCGVDADSDGASSADEDTINLWDSIASGGVNNVSKKRCLKVLDGYQTQDKMALSTAKAKTYKKLRHYLLDAFQNVYLRKLRFQHALAKDATKKIMQTAKRLRDRDGFGFDESVQYAVKKRRFLILSEMDKCFLPRNLAEKEKEDGEKKDEEEDDEEIGKD